MSLIPSHGAETEYMTSRDFSELTGIRHDNLKRKMRSMAAKDEITVTQVEGPIRTGNGAQTTTNLYRINEHDSYILMAKLNPAFIEQLVDHWKQTKNISEQSNLITLPDFTDPAAAARAWADEHEAKELAEKQLQITEKDLFKTCEKLGELEQQLEDAQPAIELQNRYEKTKTLCNMQSVARKHGIKCKDLSQFIRDKNIARYVGLHNDLIPYQEHIDAERFVVVPWQNGNQRGEHMRFTAKGEIWIIKKYWKHKNALSENPPHLRLIARGNH